MVASLLMLSLRSLPQRKVALLAMFVGVGTTVGVFIAVLAMAQSLTDMLNSNADPSRVIVLSKDALWEEASFLSREAVAQVSLSRCIARAPNGGAAMSPLALASVTLFGPDDSVTGVAIRGYHPDWLQSGLQLLDGRWPQAGLHELAVGEWAPPAAAIGSKILVNAHMWTVVGVFESETSLAGALLADAEALINEYERNGYNAVSASLAADCDADALQGDLRSAGLEVDVVTEPEYAAQVVEVLDNFRTMSVVVGVPMALGAIFCVFGVASMAVRERRRELGVLVAMGFRPAVAAMAVVVEFMLVAGACAVFSCVVVAAVMSGELITFGVSTASLTFAWQSSASLFATAVIFAGIGALVGAIVPAVRLSRRTARQLLESQ